ncbi:STAS/SEC14 domain-containing protein [Moritella marina ATCC 15381]|uniref:STAS/SEC14 domain-containing protein n=1 Tax=Moritella marina ATCC 15381 TaxID=1202962 RepID=A0A5J6WGR8_MORMI|nr:STAS/SEC14 domain-containing protein [Moritella marina]QFI36714.1 STAS/SEC14 domain-containing protein [Moritella marina ATCC 15381]
MLEMIDIEMDNAVAFQMSGKITEGDMALVLNVAKEKISRYGSIMLFEKINSFSGVEFSALIEEFKYLFDVGISNIDKVAILTDKKWIEHIVNIEDKIFKSIDMKCFALEEQSQAIAFLKGL